MMKSNLACWFEIPVTDMSRAITFYETVFQVPVDLHDFGGFKMGWFPQELDKPGSPGSLILHEKYEPSDQKGVLLYLYSEDVNNELSRIEQAGGTILQPKTLITEDIGYMALFIDSEGNRMALHSRS